MPKQSLPTASKISQMFSDLPPNKGEVAAITIMAGLVAPGMTAIELRAAAKSAVMAAGYLFDEINGVAPEPLYPEIKLPEGGDKIEIERR